MSKIKINAPYNGGMFGGWNWVDYSMIPTCVSAIIAKRTGKPVKWVFNRRDDFTFGSMDAMQAEYKVGMKLDGTITAVKVRTYFENMAIEAAGHLFENTRIPNILLRDRARPGEQGTHPRLAVRAAARILLSDPRIQPRGRGA